MEKRRKIWNFALDKRIIYKPYPRAGSTSNKIWIRRTSFIFPTIFVSALITKKKTILSYANIYLTFLTECPDEPRTRKLLVEFSPFN